MIVEGRVREWEQWAGMCFPASGRYVVSGALAPVTIDPGTIRAFKDAANEELRGILAFSEEPLVSVDFKQNPNSSIVDAEYTKVIGGKMLKVLSWYDNEWGYSCRVRDLIKYISSKGL